MSGRGQQTMSRSYRVAPSGGDIWLLHWLGCCVTRQTSQKRPRIDRSMIGNPTDFVHLSHVGSQDMHEDQAAVQRLQQQMCSKGERQGAPPASVALCSSS